MWWTWIAQNNLCHIRPARAALDYLATLGHSAQISQSIELFKLHVHCQQFITTYLRRPMF